MTHLRGNQASTAPVPEVLPARALAQRLAAAGLRAQVSHRRDTCELSIVGVANGKSFVALAADGQARWYYEPAAGPLTSPAALTAIIGYLLDAPPGTASLAAYGALPSRGRSADPCRTRD